MSKVSSSFRWRVDCVEDRYIFSRKKCCGKSCVVGLRNLVKVYTEVPTQTGVTESWWRTGAVCPYCKNFIHIADYELPQDVFENLPRIAARRSSKYKELTSEEKRLSTYFFRGHFVCSPVLRGGLPPHLMAK